MDVRGDSEGVEGGVGRVEGEIGSREGERRLAVEEWEMLTRENMSLREQLSDYMYDMKKLKQKVFELEELIQEHNNQSDCQFFQQLNLTQNDMKKSQGNKIELSQIETEATSNKQISELKLKIGKLQEQTYDLQSTIQQIEEEKQLLLSQVEDMKAELELNNCVIDNKKYQSDNNNNNNFQQVIKNTLRGTEENYQRRFQRFENIMRDCMRQNEGRNREEIIGLREGIERVSAQNEELQKTVRVLAEMMVKMGEREDGNQRRGERKEDNRNGGCEEKSRMKTHKKKFDSEKFILNKEGSQSSSKTLEEITESIITPAYNHTLFDSNNVVLSNSLPPLNTPFPLNIPTQTQNPNPRHNLQPPPQLAPPKSSPSPHRSPKPSLLSAHQEYQYISSLQHISSSQHLALHNQHRNLRSTKSSNIFTEKDKWTQLQARIEALKYENEEIKRSMLV